MSILVVGNATVDIFYEIKRLPSTGETLLASERMVDAGGKGLNQAIAASRSGGLVDYVAPLGDDAAASVIRDRLATERLRIAELLIGPFQTDESIILVTPDGSNTIVSTNSAARWLTFDTVARRLESVQAKDTLLLQGNLTKETTKKCLEVAVSAGARTVLNPSPIGFSYDEIWPLVNLAVVNEIEAAQLGNSEDPETAGRYLLKAGVGKVVVTLGPDGAIAIDEVDRITLKAPKMDVVDTAGAGDAFVGSLVAALDLGLPLMHSMKFAVQVASLTVTQRGTTSAFPSQKKIANLLKCLPSEL